MNVAISGTKGYALIVDGDTVDSIDLDGRRLPARIEDARRMLDEPGDTLFIECKDLAEVQQSLHAAADKADGLHLTLILLDPSLSSDTRREASGELAALFEVESTIEYVERVLYARPLGPDHDLPGAQALASARLVVEFLDRLQAVQRASDWVQAAWNQIPEDMFIEAPRRETFANFVQLGVVRELVKLVKTVAPDKRPSHTMPLSSRDDMQPVLAKWFSQLSIPDNP